MYLVYVYDSDRNLVHKSISDGHFVAPPQNVFDPAKVNSINFDSAASTRFGLCHGSQGQRILWTSLYPLIKNRFGVFGWQIFFSARMQGENSPGVEILDRTDVKSFRLELGSHKGDSIHLSGLVL